MNLKILVVDDEDKMRSAIVRSLRRYRNVELHEAASLTQAKRALEEHHAKGEPFHLVITDTQLPEAKGAGFEVLAHARALSPRTAVIGLSGSIEVHERQYAELGAQAFLPKPFEDKAFRLAVREHGFGRHGIEPQERG